MFNQPKNKTRQPQARTPEEVSQALQAEETSKQAIAELSDQELDQISGGFEDPLIHQPDGSYKPLFPYIHSPYGTQVK